MLITIYGSTKDGQKSDHTFLEFIAIVSVLQEAVKFGISLTLFVVGFSGNVDMLISRIF